MLHARFMRCPVLEGGMTAQGWPMDVCINSEAKGKPSTLLSATRSRHLSLSSRSSVCQCHLHRHLLAIPQNFQLNLVTNLELIKCTKQVLLQLDRLAIDTSDHISKRHLSTCLPTRIVTMLSAELQSTASHQQASLYPALSKMPSADQYVHPQASG